MKDRKKKVLMYSTFENKIGGPLVYLRSIVDSELNEEYEFSTCFQNETAGGINFNLLRRMTKQIKEQSPDIVHVHGLQSEGLYGVLAARLAGCRCVVMTVHGFAFDGQKKRGMKWLLYRYFVEPLTLWLSDEVYCVCQYASEREIIKRNVKISTHAYIHNAVGTPVITRTREEIRSKWNITEKETVFVIAGRVTKEKGFDILECAVKQLNRTGRNKFRLMVIGDGDYAETFCTEMSDEIASGQVIMVGQTEQVADFLGASDVFILPSYHENLPIALLEAGKMGLACIASAVGGIPEVIQDGESGFLVKDMQPASYVKKMNIFMEDVLLRDTMGKKMKENVEKRFAMPLMCEKIREVYVNGISRKYSTKQNIC